MTARIDLADSTAMLIDRPDDAYALPAADVTRRLAVDPTQGLDPAEAQRRLGQFGPNAMRARETVGVVRLWINQFRGAIVYLLAAAALLSGIFAEWSQVAAIAAVLLINATIGFVTEWRAVRAMETLRNFGAQHARVRRGGRTLIIPAPTLVPGDIVLLDGGDVVPADLRLLEAASLACDESALTGESLATEKSVEPVPARTVLADRLSMAFKGTAITRGTGSAVVVGTGLDTELGRITQLVDQAGDEQSPLEERLERLSRQLIWVTLVLAGLIFVAGAISGKDLVLMAEAGVALAVAAIPEGLPVVATLALARGMLRMARENALVERLSAVETLGATTVILTDKTGTLTENRMAVERLILPSGEYQIARETGKPLRDGQPLQPDELAAAREAIRIGVMCSNASYDAAEGNGTGDPTEVAFLRAGDAIGIERAACLEQFPEIAEYAFDSTSKRMATVHRAGADVVIAVKGAPEAVLGDCTSVIKNGAIEPLTDQDRADWLALAEHHASQGLRLLALAGKQAQSATAAPYPDLVLHGLAALHDPPRNDVQQAIRDCQDAGIAIVMVTGDHAGTARSVAHSVGLADKSVAVAEGSALPSLSSASDETRQALRKTAIFARVSPEQKLDLIRLFQEDGQIVAMTGDGVNDAPALRQADIGIAMGQRGTQVAREAADIVLRDDAFSTIATAIREGRVIFGNIRRFVTYLLSCNLSEVLVVGLAVIVGLPLPLLPLQILFLNLVTDVFPAFALGFCEGKASVMREPPRPPREGILPPHLWRRIIAYGVLITMTTLGVLLIATHVIGLPPGQATTVSFLTLALAQLWHVFNMRADGTPLWRNEVVRNPFVWGAVLVCIVLLLLATYLPPLASVLSIEAPDRSGWFLIVAASLVPLAIGEAWRVVARRRAQSSEDRSAA